MYIDPRVAGRAIVESKKGPRRAPATREEEEQGLGPHCQQDWRD